MFTPYNVILALKVAVSAVTVLLVAAVVAVVLRHKRLHGRLNVAFFALTMTTVVLFEVVIRLVNPALTAGFSPETRHALNVHLCFAVPAALLMPVMLWTGLSGRAWLHRPLSLVFAAVWLGTFVTGVFTLPLGE